MLTFNALALRPSGTGVQTYIRELLSALIGTTTAHLAAIVQSDAIEALPAAVEPRPRPVASGLRRAIAGLRSPGPADLVHGLDVDLPLRCDVATVTTVHDLSVFDVPWTFPRHRVLGERRLVRRAVRGADAVIAPSSFTAERIAAVLGREATVVLEAPPTDMAPAADEAVDALRAQLRLPETFVLHVGTAEPRKDLPTLVAACQAARVPLLLAGPGSPEAGVRLGCRGLGYVARSDLAALYAAATVVAFPSRYEGFGLPPLEAMVCGAPVVVSRVASLPEVVGAGAVLVPPGAVERWAAALRDVVADRDQRAQLAEAGRRRAAQLSWSATANATLGVYRRLGLRV